MMCSPKYPCYSDIGESSKIILLSLKPEWPREPFKYCFITYHLSNSVFNIITMLEAPKQFCVT